MARFPEFDMINRPGRTPEDRRFLMREMFKTMPLDTALKCFKEGEMTRAEWQEYAHLWQTSAPRFELRACTCADCVKNYPTPEYTQVGIPNVNRAYSGEVWRRVSDGVEALILTSHGLIGLATARPAHDADHGERYFLSIEDIANGVWVFVQVSRN